MATAPKNLQDLSDGALDFYRERLREAFSVSETFGRSARAIVDTPEFGKIVAEYGLGSLDSARRIGDMAVIYLDKILSAGPAGETSALQRPRGSATYPEAALQPGEWWRDLLNYERAQFLQLATTQQPPPWNRPRRGVSASCVNFGWNLPELVKRLKTGQAVTEELRRPMTLLFTRNQDGKVVVVEAGVAVEKVFRATNGMRTVPQIAEAAGMGLAETERILSALAGVGAIVQGKGASEMLEAIQAKERQGT
jgi:hypothetical protein